MWTLSSCVCLVSTSLISTPPFFSSCPNTCCVPNEPPQNTSISPRLLDHFLHLQLCPLQDLFHPVSWPPSRGYPETPPDSESGYTRGTSLPANTPVPADGPSNRPRLPLLTPVNSLNCQVGFTSPTKTFHTFFGPPGPKTNEWGNLKLPGSFRNQIESGPGE